MIASLVIPSYRGVDRLPRLLDSLTRQRDDAFEVVVALDGDVDGSADLLATRADLPLRVVRLATNQGRAAALNAGLAAATGDVVARVDDDLVLPSGYVAALHRAHADRAVGVIGLCRNVYPDRTPYAAAYGEDADAALHAGAYAAPPETRWRYWGGNVSVRRADLDRVGPYDESFTRYGWEDVDWGYRLHRAGREIVVDPDLVADHHVAATTTAVRALRAYESGRSQIRFEGKHGRVVPGKADGPRTVWQRLVAREADGLRPETIRARGERIDHALHSLPRAIGRKRVALLVEASARAGYLAAGVEPCQTLAR